MASQMELMVRIAADANRYAAELTRAGGATSQFTSSTKAKFSTLTRSIAAFGVQLGAVALTARSFSSSTGIEGALASVESNFRKSTTSAQEWISTLKDVKSTAFDVQKVTLTSYKDVIGITDAYLKAGVSMDAIKGKQGAAWAAASLSTITGRDANEIGDDMARLGTSFGLKNDQYGKAADTLARGEAASPGKLEEILYSLRQFSSSAKNMSVSFDDAVAAAAVATPLGGMAGTSINSFIGMSAGKTKLQRNAMIEAGLATNVNGKFQSKAFDNKGQFVGLDKWAATVRETFKGIENQQKKSILASQIWGKEGERFAMLLANVDDDKTFAAMKQEMKESLGLQDRMDIITNTFGASLTKAKNSLDLFGAKLSEPLLGPGQAVLETVSNGADSVTEWMNVEGNTEKMLVGGAALAALWKGIQIVKGKKGIKNNSFDHLISDTTGIGQGVITGKVLQSAAGVTPVYVVNMPEGGLGGGLGGLAGGGLGGIGGGAAAGGVAKGGLLRGLATRGMMAIGAAGGLPVLAIRGGLLGAAGYAGYKTGEAAYNKMDSTENGQVFIDSLGERLTGIMAFLGSSTAQDALEANQIAQAHSNNTVANDVINGNMATDFGAKAAAELTAQMSSVNEALASTIKGTDLGGTINIKVIADNAQAQVQANPNQSTIKYNLGITNGGAN